MSMPPQGGWPPQGPPPNQGPPNYGPPPPGWQQGPWQPVPPSPPKSNTIKWLLVGIAVLLVVGVSIGATLLFTRDSGGGGATPTSGVPSDIASANDTGPVGIITDDPTCDAFMDINNGSADVQNKGWNVQRKILGAASEWTEEQRAQVEAVVTVMRNASDQMVALAKQTPHRVMRELYEQYIAYGRAYADSVPNYAPGDNYLADTNVSAGNVLKGICTTALYKSSSRALAITPATTPTRVAPPGNPADPQRFIESKASACTAWLSNEDEYFADSKDWEKLDANIPAANWTPEQRATQLAVLPVFSTLADNMESVGRKSDNAVFEDFAVLGALYSRAYVSTGDTYTIADSSLSYTALRINNTISGACRAAGN